MATNPIEDWLHTNLSVNAPRSTTPTARERLKVIANQNAGRMALPTPTPRVVVDPFKYDKLKTNAGRVARTMGHLGNALKSTPFSIERILQTQAIPSAEFGSDDYTSKAARMETALMHQMADLGQYFIPGMQHPFVNNVGDFLYQMNYPAINSEFERSLQPARQRRAQTGETSPLYEFAKVLANDKWQPTADKILHTELPKEMQGYRGRAHSDVIGDPNRGKYWFDLGKDLALWPSTVLSELVAPIAPRVIGAMTQHPLQNSDGSLRRDPVTGKVLRMNAQNQWRDYVRDDWPLLKGDIKDVMELLKNTIGPAMHD